MLKRVARQCILTGDCSRLEGVHERLWGEVDPELIGNVSGIEGYVSELTGDATGIEGSVEGYVGPLDAITEEGPPATSPSSAPAAS